MLKIHVKKSAEFLCGYNLPRVMKLLNVGHQNILGTTNTDYKFKIVTVTPLTDRFLFKTYFWKYNLLQAIVYTEINVRANVSDFGTVDKGTGIP